MENKSVGYSNDISLETVILYGKLMLESNYGVSEVKRNLIQLMIALDINIFSFYITPTNLMLINKKTNDVKMISIESSSYNFEKMGQVKSVVDDFYSKKTSINQLYEQLEIIEQNKATFPIYIQVIFAGLMCGAMNILINKLTIDVVFASLIGGFCYFLYSLFQKHIGIKNFSIFLYSTLVSIFAVILVNYHFAQSAFSLVLSCMMPLLPGATLVNAIRDSIEGDYFSSISQISEAISTALMLGLPVAFILANFL